MREIILKYFNLMIKELFKKYFKCDNSILLGFCEISYF